MLIELSIKDFAIIEELSIDFKDGLTVLTGETGAGKSIIIDAVQLLTGKRASTEFIRYGKEKAEISGIFDVKSNESLSFLIETYDIDVEEDTLVLERSIMANNKSVARINGKIVPLKTLRLFGELLVDIHSQHDTYRLMHASEHLKLLDSFNRSLITPHLNKYQQIYLELIDLKKEKESIDTNEKILAQQLDLYEFQSKELAEASLEANEDELLEKEREGLVNFEKIYHTLESAYFTLIGEEKAIELLNLADSALESSTELNEFIKEKSAELKNVIILLEEMALEIGGQRDLLEFDESRLNEIESRLNDLNLLKRKYGNTVEEILAYQVEVNEKIDKIKNKEMHTLELDAKIKEKEKEAIELAKQMSKVRQKTAQELEEIIKEELKELYLEEAQFKVDFKTEQTEGLLNEYGCDTIQFLLSTNKGEPLKALDKIASGGELSRIMLVLKKIFVTHENIGTVIFDEIDTGVSGRVAQSIAEKMYDISESSQTLCITHLPQVAAMSDEYLLIEKSENNKRTTTRIHKLSNEAKVIELSKMITGSQITPAAQKHSKELIQLCNSYKQKK